MPDARPPVTDLLAMSTSVPYVAVIEITRGPHNFLTPSLVDALADTYDHAIREGFRAIVLCSEGRNFCAGADLGGEMQHPDGPAQLYGALARLLSTELPVVAAVQGAAVGGGVGLALTADFRVAATSARMWLNFATLGLHHGFGLTITLPRLVGAQTAARLLLTAREVRGQELVSLGLCDEVVDEERLREAATAFAALIATGAPSAIRDIRRTLRAGLPEQVQRATQHELREQARHREMSDFREGVRASLERRPPEFHDR